MNKCFYLKMAVGNLRRNKEIYFPYLLASGLMIMVFYTFMLIAGNPGMENIPQSDTIQMIMTIGVWVGAIFSVIFIFYANSFLMKRRKKEFGLYGILGLEKRHVARIMVYETGLAALCAVGGGIIIGTVFSKLSFLILLKVMHVTKDSTLIIRLSSVVKTVILFLCIFLLAAVFNLLQIRMSHPIDLMSSKSKGEKEPKGSVVLAILGVIFLGIGYYLALTVRRDMLDLPVMFEAVLAVMAGTYCLFISLSIKILRLLKRNKKLYYKPDNFISVSGLIYRMRQNAVGLASICIICTMIIITLSVTVSFQVGGTDSVKKMVGVDLAVENIPTKEYENLLLNGLKELAPKYDITIERCDVFPDKKFNGFYKDGQITSAYGGMNAEEETVYPPFYNLNLMSAKDYKRITGEEINPEKNHGVLVMAKENFWQEDNRAELAGEQTLKFYGGKADGGSGGAEEYIDETVIIDGVIYNSPLINDKYVTSSSVYMIVSDEDMVGKLDNCYVGRDYTVAIIEFEGSETDREAFVKELKAPLDATGYAASFRSLEEYKENFFIGYGGLVFMGVMLSILFLLAMVLIIYYKQLSEGMEDRERYQIMLKVGIEEKDIKKTISKQVRTIFFVPLIVSVIHTAAAFKLTSNLISSVMYRNYPLFAGCTVIVVLFAAAVYGAVYGITAKIYYKLIH